MNDFMGKSDFLNLENIGKNGCIETIVNVYKTKIRKGLYFSARHKVCSK